MIVRAMKDEWDPQRDHQHEREVRDQGVEAGVATVADARTEIPDREEKRRVARDQDQASNARDKNVREPTQRAESRVRATRASKEDCILSKNFKGDGDAGMHRAVAAPGWRFRWDLLLPVAGVATLPLLWWFGSQTTDFIPSISEVLDQAPEFYGDPDTYFDIRVTVQRVIGALAASMTAGFIAAYIISRGGFAAKVTNVYVWLTLGVPSTIAALISLYVFRRSEIGVYVTVAIVTFPFATVILVEGLKTLDRRLEEMSTSYHVRGLRRTRHVVVPHLVPYIMAALRNENGHAWKVVVLAELFSVNTGMGYRFSQAFDRFLVVDVMLWLITFTVILLSTEYLLLRPLERYTQRWREVTTRPVAVAQVGEAPS
jgi:NitT/TauT family transport system permease protein